MKPVPVLSSSSNHRRESSDAAGAHNDVRPASNTLQKLAMHSSGFDMHNGDLSFPIPAFFASVGLPKRVYTSLSELNDVSNIPLCAVHNAIKSLSCSFTVLMTFEI